MSSTSPNFYTLLRLLQSQRSKLTIAITLACLAALLELPPYWIIYQALELGLAADTQAVLGGDFLLLAGWMLLALLLKYLTYSASYYFSHKAAYQVLADTRLSLLQHVSRANYQWLQQQGSGRIKQTIMQDVEELEAFIAHHTVETVTGFLMPVFVTFLLLALDWRLALAALAAIPLAALASWIPLSRLGKHFERFNQAAGQLNATMVEYVRNMPVMKTFCQDVKSFQYMRRQIDDYYALIGAVTHRTVPGWSLFTVLLTANAFLTLPLGIWLYQSQAISLPELMLALILAAGMLRPLFKLTNLSSEYQQVMTSLGNIMRLLQMPASQAQAVLQIDAQASIQLEQVAYSLAGKTLLHPCSLKIDTPGMTAIVGPSGAGKSTLAKLMSGVLLPSAGCIKLHGQAMADMLDEQRTQLITLVSQEVFLFKGSILENLLLAAPFASPLAIDTALRTAQAKSFVDALPLGLKTEIGERGLSLSGGERQRLAIARALLANTPLLILDEATAFADNLTEQRFLTALRQDYPNTMLIVISHRFQALEHAREIIVMDQGHIIAQGQHQDLLRQCLTYQSLWHRHKASVHWTLNRLPDQASASARGVA